MTASPNTSSVPRTRCGEREKIFPQADIFRQAIRGGGHNYGHRQIIIVPRGERDRRAAGSYPPRSLSQQGENQDRGAKDDEDDAGYAV